MTHIIVTSYAHTLKGRERLLSLIKTWFTADIMLGHTDSQSQYGRLYPIESTNPIIPFILGGCLH